MKKLIFILLMVMNCSLWSCSSSFRDKQIVNMYDVHEHGKKVFAKKVGSAIEQSKKDSHERHQHSRESQRLMKTKKMAIDASLELALICPVLVFCSQKITIQIRITDIIAYDCNNDNFNPRFCPIDCDKIDYTKDPRCLDCFDKHKDIDICINCDQLKIPEKYKKEKCCKEVIEGPDSDDYIPIDHCCELEKYKEYEKCDCEYFLKRFRIKDPQKYEYCCAKPEYKYTDRCDHCSKGKDEQCCKEMTREQIDKYPELRAFCCEKEHGQKCNCEMILGNIEYKIKYPQAWAYCCKQNPDKLVCDRCYESQKVYDQECCIKYTKKNFWSADVEKKCCEVFKNDKSELYAKHCLDCDDQDKDKERCIDYKCQDLFSKGFKYDVAIKNMQAYQQYLNDKNQGERDKAQIEKNNDLLEKIKEQLELLEECCHKNKAPEIECKAYNNCDNERYFKMTPKCCAEIYQGLDRSSYTLEIDKKLQECCSIWDEDQNYCKCDPRIQVLIGDTKEKIQSGIIVGQLSDCCGEIAYDKPQYKPFIDGCCDKFQFLHSKQYSDYHSIELRKVCCKESLRVANDNDFIGSLDKYYEYCCSLLPNEDICYRNKCMDVNQFDSDCCSFYLDDSNILKYKNNAEECCDKYYSNNKDMCTCSRYLQFKLNIKLNDRDRCCEETYEYFKTQTNKDGKQLTEQQRQASIQTFYQQYMPYCLGNCFSKDIKQVIYEGKLSSKDSSLVMTGFKAECCEQYMQFMKQTYSSQKAEIRQEVVTETTVTTVTVKYTVNGVTRVTTYKTTEVRQIVKTYKSYETRDKIEQSMQSLSDICCQYKNYYKDNEEACRPEPKKCKEMKDTYDKDCCVEWFQGSEPLNDQIVKKCCDFFYFYRDYWDMLKFMYPYKPGYVREMGSILKQCGKVPEDGCDEIMANPLFSDAYKIKQCCHKEKYSENDICKRHACKELSAEKCKGRFKVLFQITSQGGSYTTYAWKEEDIKYYHQCCYCEYILKLEKQADSNRNGNVQTALVKIDGTIQNRCNACTYYATQKKREIIPKYILERCCKDEFVTRLAESKYGIDMQQICEPDPYDRCLAFPRDPACCELFAKATTQYTRQQLIAKITRGNSQFDSIVIKILDYCCNTNENFYLKYCDKQCDSQLKFPYEGCCDEIMKTYFVDVDYATQYSNHGELPFNPAVTTDQKTQVLRSMYKLCCGKKSMLNYYKKCRNDVYNCEQVYESQNWDEAYMIYYCCAYQKNFLKLKNYRSEPCCQEQRIFGNQKYLQVYKSVHVDNECCQQEGITSGGLDKWHKYCCQNDKFGVKFHDNCCVQQFNILNDEQKSQCCTYFNNQQKTQEMQQYCCHQKGGIFVDTVCCQPNSGIYYDKCCETMFNKKQCCKLETYKNKEECYSEIPPIIFPPFKFCELFPIFCEREYIWIIIIIPPFDFCIHPCCCPDNKINNVFCNCNNEPVIPLPPPPRIRYDLCIDEQSSLSKYYSKYGVSGMDAVIRHSTLAKYEEIVMNLAICLCRNYGVFCHQCFFNPTTKWCSCHPILELLGYYRHGECSGIDIYIPPNLNCLNNFKTFLGHRSKGLWSKYKLRIQAYEVQFRKSGKNPELLTYDKNAKKVKDFFNIQSIEQQFKAAFYNIDECCEDRMMENIQFEFTDSKVNIDIHPEYRKLIDAKKDSIETPKGQFVVQQRQRFYSYMCEREQVQCTTRMQQSVEEYKKLKDQLKPVVEQSGQDTKWTINNEAFRALQLLRHDIMHCCLQNENKVEGKEYSQMFKDVCCQVIVLDQKFKQDVKVIEAVGAMHPMQLSYYYKLWGCEKATPVPTCKEINENLKDTIINNRDVLFGDDPANENEYKRVMAKITQLYNIFVELKCCDEPDNDYIICDKPEPNTCYDFFFKYRMKKSAYTDEELYYKVFNECCEKPEFKGLCCRTPEVKEDPKKVVYCCENNYMDCCDEKARFKYLSIIEESDKDRFTRECCTEKLSTCCENTSKYKFFYDAKYQDICCTEYKKINTKLYEEVCEYECTIEMYMTRTHPMHKLCCLMNPKLCLYYCEDKNKDDPDFKEKCCDDLPYSQQEEVCPFDCQKQLNIIQAHKKSVKEEVLKYVYQKCCSQSQYLKHKFCDYRPDCDTLIKETPVDKADKNHPIKQCCKYPLFDTKKFEELYNKVCKKPEPIIKDETCDELLKRLENVKKEEWTEKEKTKVKECCKDNQFIGQKLCEPPVPDIPDQVCEVCGEVVGTQEVYYSEGQRRFRHKNCTHKSHHHHHQHKKDSTHHRK